MPDEKDARIRTMERELADRQREYRTLSDDHERLERIARAAERMSGAIMLAHASLGEHRCGFGTCHCCKSAQSLVETLAAYRKATGEPK